MNFVEPIRDKRKIVQIKNLLKADERYRDLLLFTVGVNTALRVSDLLALRIGQLVDADGKPNARFWIREEKRGKRKEVTINSSMADAIKPYAEAYPAALVNPDHFAFFNLVSKDYTEAIDRVQAWRLIQQFTDAAGLSGNYGTHTLRKTWAYHARLAGVPLELIMEMLNHNSLAYTKRYLGITDDELADVARRLNL